MRHKDLFRLSFQRRRTYLARHTRFILTLCLISLLSTTPLSPTRVRAQHQPPHDGETLFRGKSDFLLQSIRRATLGTLPDGLSFETAALSRLAGVRGEVGGATRVSLTVSLATNDDSELKAAGFSILARLGQLATIETDVNRLPELATLPSVLTLTAATRSYPNNDLSRRAIGVDDAMGQRVVSQTGSGVIVAIIDDGIDFRHLDFTVPGSNGHQTRIKALLDMTVYSSQAPPLPPDPNWNYVLPGATSPIGHLYTESDINAALQGQGTVQQRNWTGHGTHVAGTAAGNGLSGPVPGKYAGVAPEADLIVVKASRQKDGSDNFLESDQINALAFVQQKAAELGKPFVINMSMAGHFGSHDGTRASERAIDEVVSAGVGRAVCVSGGSTGDMHAHASGTLIANIDLNLKINVRDATQLVWLSYPHTDNVTVKVTRADGVQTGFVAYNPNQVPGASSQYLDVFNTLDDKRDSDPQNDQKAIIVLLKPGATGLGPFPHTWTITLHGSSIANGHFDAWASLEGDFVTNVDDSRQTTVPGTARGAITVGGYVTRAGDRPIGDYASFSSQGPTADGRLKPEISAPAFSVFSAKAAGSLFFNSPLAPDSSSHVGAYGNSFATPAVAGAVALLLQANPQLTPDQIKDILKTTATRDSFTGTALWEPHFGFGKLNIAAAIAASSRTIQLTSSSYSVGEGNPRVDVALVRSGDSSAPASVTFATDDATGLQNCNVKNGIASPRCDYINTTGTIQFAAGETSKSVSIAIVDDSYAEGNETFTVSLSGPSGSILGPHSSATVGILDNETVDGPNPIDTTNFFVRQLYLDFLGREPDPSGFAAWVDTINDCSGDTTQCDRIHVSQSFFQSSEFQQRGYFIYRFYPVSFGRKPDFAELIPDLARVSGFLNDAQLEAAKVAFINDFMARPAFVTYNGLGNTQFVDTLLANAVLTHPARVFWIAALGNGTRTRAEVLREIAESSEAYNKYYNQAFVVMQYFGYLRRQPDAFYLDWIAVLDQSNDPRGMITGFATSPEYRLRFGAQ